MNPLFDYDTRGRSDGIFRSRRIDRMNKVAPVDERFQVDYNKIKMNLRPAEPSGPVRTPAEIAAAKQAEWAAVKTGANFATIKKHIPRADVKAPQISLEKMRWDDAVSRVRELLLSEPVVTAFDGVKVLLANPDGGKGGDGLSRRAAHLIGERQNNQQRGRVFVHDKARLVAAIPDTLKNAQVKVGHDGEHLYFRRYKDGLLHMVVVDPNGFLSDHGFVDAGLVTQYQPDVTKRFEGAKVLVKNTK
jgi:hypothetical protein